MPTAAKTAHSVKVEVNLHLAPTASFESRSYIYQRVTQTNQGFPALRA